MSSNFGKYLLFNYKSQPKIVENPPKPPIFGVQGCSKASMLVPLESSSAVLVMISSSLCLSATALTPDELIAVK